MGKMVFIIDEMFKDKAMAAFESFEVQYYIAGYPDGSVIVKETFESRMNTLPSIEVKKKALKPNKPITPKVEKKDEYDRMTEYAKSLGCDNVTEAIGKMNGARNFKKQFKKEYQNS